MTAPRTYGVQAHAREPLIEFMCAGLIDGGCRIIHRPEANEAPFRLTFETALGERLGIIAYAFLANTKQTKNRPDDEHRFQIKYGSKDGLQHTLWHDPFGLYTTLLIGINPDTGFFVSADATLHNPTRMFISVEFKQEHVDGILRSGWSAWERDRRLSEESPIEVLVGGTRSNFLRCVRFERDACGLDQGHRQLLAEKYGEERILAVPALPGGSASPAPEQLHALAREFEMSTNEVLDLIARTRRLKMAVRGWVAEEHLVRELSNVPGVSDCRRLDEEGGPDVSLVFEGSRPLSIECKNVLRKLTSDRIPRVDFQRTRASMNDPCSRYYSAADFDVVAACLHSVTERWQFRYQRTSALAPHVRCIGKLANMVRVDDSWRDNAAAVLREVSRDVRHVV